MLQNIAAHQLQLAFGGIFEVSAKSTQLSSCDNSLGGHCTEVSELFLSAKVQGFTQIEVCYLVYSQATDLFTAYVVVAIGFRIPQTVKWLLTQRFANTKREGVYSALTPIPQPPSLDVKSVYAFDLELIT